METTLAGIKALLKTKIENLQIAGEDVFSEVYDYAEGDFKSYPVAVIRNTGSDGSGIDTARIERTFHFSIDLYQEQTKEGKTKDEADALMTAAVDAVMTAFDTDPDLSGNIQIAKVVKADFDFKATAGTFNFASIKVDCLVIVSNF